eukprot:UN1623
MYVSPVRQVLVCIAFMPSSRWFQAAWAVPTFVAMLVAERSKTSYPCNYVALSVFTLLMSFNLALLCAGFYECGIGVLILIAAGVTAVLFGLLSAYAIASGRSFSCMGAYLSAALPLLCAWGFARCFFGIGGWVLYPVLGALMFCGYIVFDTWRIMEVFGCDDYMVAAIELYMDILNLFLHILEILLKILLILIGKDN